MNRLNELKAEIRALADPEKARGHQKFFQTHEGGYAEGDQFVGLTVPVQRKLAKKYLDLPSGDLKRLLASEIHEDRFTALEILVFQYERRDAVEQRRIFDFYLQNTRGINNWDLVDTSAPYIVGSYLLDKSRAILRKLAKSDNLWERRIAIVSTLAFIREKSLRDTFEISEMLLGDSHALIHKAVGWMLREAGKQDEAALRAFLRKHHSKMPRTALRYAIERFPPEIRRMYLAGEVSA